MARIRTIKPEFFRHELLQELEKKYPEARPMLVFCALWGHCDKAGSFLWKTRTLGLDVLPFLGISIADTLQILVEAHLVLRYSVRGVDYGNVPSFSTHQRIGGKEAIEPARFPPPPRGSNGAAPGKHSGSGGAAPGQHRGKQEGKGREGKGIKTRAGARAPVLAVDNSKSARQENRTEQPLAATAQPSSASAATAKATA